MEEGERESEWDGELVKKAKRGRVKMNERGKWERD